jgi:peptidoglycan/LPS O-acetylase OafA/YrhL
VRSLDYMPRLDGIRALAVAGVLFEHFMWNATPLASHGQFGRVGVRVFFTLSGFLITRILLDYRDRMPPLRAAATFYWHRFLRLFPAYYLAIAVSLALGIANMRADWPIHVLYLSNFLLAARGHSEPIGHLWSLSVEEQFYLFWFVVVVCMPRRWLMPAIIGAIVTAPIFRFLTSDLPGRPAALTPAVIDSLAYGALIGVSSLRNGPLYRAFGNWLTFWISAAASVLMVAFFFDQVVMGTLFGVFAASFIALAANPETRGLNWLEWQPLKDIGKISYGIYLYHKFLPLLLARFGVTFSNPWVFAAVFTWLSIVVAAASWRFIERPALLLKRLSPDKAIRRAPREVSAVGRNDLQRVDGRI